MPDDLMTITFTINHPDIEGTVTQDYAVTLDSHGEPVPSWVDARWSAGMYLGEVMMAVQRDWEDVVDV